MPLSLHTVTVQTFQQMLGALDRILDRAQAHCAEQGMAEDTLVQARLADDMQPFAYQIKSAVVHSMGAIEGVKAGQFRPDDSIPPDSFAGLKAQLREGIAYLDALAPAEVDALEGRDMRFGIGDRHIDFLAEDFLLSFSLPNFYFHVTTAYDILRMRGVSLGKRDYLGRMRKKR